MNAQAQASTNTDKLGFLPPPPLTPEQRAYVLRVRGNHWNEPMSLWKPIVFSKEKKKVGKVVEAPKPVVKKNK